MGSAFANGADLIRDREVGLVSGCVRVPAHRELGGAAVQTGKHVYCESPLGRTTAEAEEMAEAARKMGVRTGIGLQTRASPVGIKAMPVYAANVAGIYAALRNNIQQRTSTAPDFHQPVLLSRLTDTEIESTQTTTGGQLEAKGFSLSVKSKAVNLTDQPVLAPPSKTAMGLSVLSPMVLSQTSESHKVHS